MPAPTPTETHPPHLAQRTNAEWRALHDEVFPANYGPRRVALVRGEGSRVWDAEGKEYLDFLTGISVNNLGHCHPRITAAIQEQAATLVHCSNLYYIPAQIEFARLLTSSCFADKVFFGNSGAEANEAAFKIARRWARETRGPNINHIISMKQSFHGRTITTLSATGQDKVWKNFYPLARGFYFARFNDLESVRRLITKRVCAIILEPIQGESGIRPAEAEFLKGVRALCDEHNLILIFDEVQCGLGRAGTLFAHQGYGVEPDIMTLAKSLGGGIAMGAMLTTNRVAGAFAPGAHASTGGGNALICAAARAYLSELIEGDWPARAKESGLYLTRRLREELAGCENVVEIRGRGLMLGVEVREGAQEILKACEDRGLLVNVTGGSTVRLLPPLNISREDLDLGISILAPAIRSRGQAAS